jgi:hypothetical protein
MEGWSESTQGARRWADLPARDQIRPPREELIKPSRNSFDKPERDDTILATRSQDDRASARGLKTSLLVPISAFGYWGLTALSLRVFGCPPNISTATENPLVVAWNWSFMPLDMILSLYGLAAVTLHRRAFQRGAVSPSSPCRSRFARV